MMIENKLIYWGDLIIFAQNSDFMENDLITVKTVAYVHEAAILQAKLESEGIFCFVQDELTVPVHPFLSNGGIKLQVREEDVEKTIQVLNEVERLENSGLRCPFCESSEIFNIRISTKLSVI